MQFCWRRTWRLIVLDWTVCGVCSGSAPITLLQLVLATPLSSRCCPARANIPADCLSRALRAALHPSRLAHHHSSVQILRGLQLHYCWARRYAWLAAHTSLSHWKVAELQKGLIWSCHVASRGEWLAATLALKVEVCHCEKQARAWGRAGNEWGSER